MVMIEAMVCGTPVVALNAGAVPEIVVDGVTGFVRDHPADLAAAVRQVSTLDPTACRRHVETNFTATQLGTGYGRVYREVLRRRQGTGLPSVPRMLDSISGSAPSPQYPPRAGTLDIRDSA